MTPLSAGPERWERAKETPEMHSTLLAAVEAENWPEVVELIERDWPVLMAVGITALDAALHALPAEIWAAHPTTAAVREIRINVRGDTGEFDRLAMNAPLPSQPGELRILGRGAESRAAIGMAVAFMIAYRVHGQHRKALYFANIAEVLLRHARVARPNEISMRVPTALLQIGITRMVAGEYHRASLLLREAYELRDETWDARVGGDAAGKLALLYAVRGETAEARRWLLRHDDGLSATGWMIPLVQLSARVAAALIAIDSLDQAAAEDALRAVELQVNRERSWAPFVAFAHASFALLWGDQRAALERIGRTRRFVGDAQRDTGIEPRLDAVRANLLIAIDRSAEAREMLAQRQRSPHFAATAARLALLSGDRAAARELCAAGLAENDIDARARIDLLLMSAVADESAAGGTRHLQQATSAAARAESYAPFALAPRSPLRQLMTSMPSTATGEFLAGALASTPEPMPQSIETVVLTSTEHRVLRLLAQNAARSTIARTLYVSENTVKFHTRNVYRKLGVSSRADAITKARQLRMLADAD